MVYTVYICIPSVYGKFEDGILLLYQHYHYDYYYHYILSLSLSLPIAFTRVNF